MAIPFICIVLEDACHGQPCKTAQRKRNPQGVAFPAVNFEALNLARTRAHSVPCWTLADVLQDLEQVADGDVRECRADAEKRGERRVLEDFNVVAREGLLPVGERRRGDGSRGLDRNVGEEGRFGDVKEVGDRLVKLLGGERGGRSCRNPLLRASLRLLLLRLGVDTVAYMRLLLDRGLNDWCWCRLGGLGAHLSRDQVESSSQDEQEDDLEETDMQGVEA